MWLQHWEPYQEVQHGHRIIYRHDTRSNYMGPSESFNVPLIHLKKKKRCESSQLLKIDGHTSLHSLKDPWPDNIKP